MPKRKEPANEPKNSDIREPSKEREKPRFGFADFPVKKSKRWGRKAKSAYREPLILSGPGAKAENWVLAKMAVRLGILGQLEEEADLVALVEGGLPLGAISALIQDGILEKEIYAVIVPRRTLQHRRARKEKLSREESDRAVRLARLITLAEEVFGTRDASDKEAIVEARDEGRRWLRVPKKRFRGRTPMDMLATETGSRLVEEALYQIDEGMAA